MKRFRPSREVFFLAALLLLLAGFSAFIAIRQAQIEEAEQVFVRYSSHSARDDGTLALYEWASTLGYRSQRIENTAFRVGDQVKLLFVFAPSETIESGEARYLLQWVERGNTLFAADNGSIITNGLFRALEVKTDALKTSVERVTLTQPLADATIQELRVGTIFSGLDTKRSDVVEYIRADKPLLLRIPHGRGTIWIASAPALLSNENLRHADNAKFARAILASAPSGSAIAFDEYHLGFKPESENSLLNAIYNTPWGWGLLFTGLILFGYLVVNGQRFGRTVPVQRTLARRTPSEYVISMANLFRRANKRGMVLQHYRHALKRRLGRPFHLSPDVSDDHYVELITRMRPEMDRAALVRILNGLRRTDATEADLVKTVEQAVTFGKRAGKK
ncbi:MAG: DUF4350 domain-containing protein [Chloroflexi bacterium]|nr:DUF4350 domain-containing protein [Chloroflexota bacterium]